jgi:hypothetical protein
LQFVTSGTAEIRISFAEEGFSWSTVGTDALTVPRAEPTMNYGWLEPDTDLAEYQRVVRHEFGHAVGMIHEHQNPDAAGTIPWDKPKVYAYYARQGWSKADVDANLFDVYDTDTTNFTTFDPTSIMQYAIPEELTIGTYSVGWNTALSPTDVAFMRTQYPVTDTGVVEVTVGAAATKAAIGSGPWPAPTSSRRRGHSTPCSRCTGRPIRARSWRGTTTAARGATGGSCASWRPGRTG